MFILRFWEQGSLFREICTSDFPPQDLVTFQGACRLPKTLVCVLLLARVGLSKLCLDPRLNLQKNFKPGNLSVLVLDYYTDSTKKLLIDE